jgi:hypothetical protein
MTLCFLSINTTANTQKKYQVLLCTQLPVVYITSIKTDSYYPRQVVGPPAK